MCRCCDSVPLTNRGAATDTRVCSPGAVDPGLQTLPHGVERAAFGHVFGLTANAPARCSDEPSQPEHHHMGGHCCHTDGDNIVTLANTQQVAGITKKNKNKTKTADKQGRARSCYCSCCYLANRLKLLRRKSSHKR